MRRALWLSVVGLVSASVATPALAATYVVSFLDDAVSQSTPLRRDVLIPMSQGGDTGQYTAGGYAGPGVVKIKSQVDWQWSNVFSGGGGGSSYSSAQATDFVITGPAGPSTVSGTFHLRVSAGFAKGGGFPGSGGHTADLFFNAFANGILATGAYSHNNFASGGSGVLSGTSGGAFDVPFTISGSFPVGSPFSVFLFLKSTDFTYGNISWSPGSVATDAGGAPNDVSGRGLWLDASGGGLMTLPPGYTLNSASWGVVNNQYPSQTGVGDEERVGGLRLDVAGANPSRGEARIAYTLARDAQARVALYDVTGRVIRTLVDGRQTAGRHEYTWDGRTAAGVAAPAGLYFIRGEAEGRSVTRRLVRVR